MLDIEKFIQGDEYELEKVMEELTPRLMKYCSSILLNFADAEDAVQTTFIQAYKKRHTLREPKSFVPFLYAIAYRSSISILRKRRLFNRDPLDPVKSGGHISDSLMRGLEQLTKLDRAIVYGRAVEELSYTQLARMHQKSEASLRKRYERAKKKLCFYLREDETHE